MPLTVVSQEITARFQETRVFLQHIRASQPTTPLQPMSSQALFLLRGLFFVQLYSAFEFAVNRIVAGAAEWINVKLVQLPHLHHRIYPLALDPELTSIRDSGRSRKWESRLRLFDRQMAIDAAVLHDSVFLQDLDNVDTECLTKIFAAFDVHPPVLYDPRARQYIDEVKAKRNAISHGRESAVVYGQAMTADDLERRFEALSNQAVFMANVFENYLTAKMFVRPAFHTLY
jgi:hypothetical protein